MLRLFCFWLPCLLGLLVLVAQPGGAQPVPAADVVLRGRVLDADTRQPVPNAQVGIGGNRLGTSTSLDGRFALRVPAAYQRTTLEVALLGYQRQQLPLPPLPGPELVVYLRISPASLGTVTVAASATGIIREAVRRIPQNYPVRPTQLTGFYRESDEEAASGHYDYLAEGLLLVYKPGYQHPERAGYVQVRQARQVELRRPAGQVGGLLRINWLAGGLVPHRFDFVRERSEFINPRHFKNYQYSFGAQTTFQGRPVYVLDFGPRPGSNKANFAGRLYIDVQRYAFLGAEWHRTPAGIARERLLQFEATERAYRTYYQAYAGRYYLKNVWYNTLGKPVAGQVLHHLAEYVTTAIDTARVQPPTYPERYQYEDIFLRSPVPYDSAFWQSQTTLLPPPALRQRLLDQAREHWADSLLRAPAAARVGAAGASAPAPDSAVAGAAPVRAAAPVGRRRRYFHLAYRYGVGVSGLQGGRGTLGAVVAPGGSTFQAAAAGEAPAVALVPHYTLGYQLSLPARLLVSGEFSYNIGEYRGDGWALGLQWAANLNPRGRPLRLHLGASYLQQAVARRLGTFPNPDDGLRLAGTRLSRDQLTVALQSRTAALRPSLGLGLELSRRYELLLTGAYLVPLRTRAELLVAENGFWSSAEAALPLPAAEVQATVNGLPATSLPWRLGRYQLGLELVWQL